MLLFPDDSLQDYKILADYLKQRRITGPYIASLQAAYLRVDRMEDRLDGIVDRIVRPSLLRLQDILAVEESFAPVLENL